MTVHGQIGGVSRKKTGDFVRFRVIIVLLAIIYRSVKEQVYGRGNSKDRVVFSLFSDNYLPSFFFSYVPQLEP